MTNIHNPVGAPGPDLARGFGAPFLVATLGPSSVGMEAELAKLGVSEFPPERVTHDAR